MTVILAIKQDNCIYVGADRQLSAGDIKSYASDSKIIKKTIRTDDYKFKEDSKELVILTTGYAHYTGFLKYVFEPPTIDTLNDFEYVNKLVQKFRTEIKKSAWLVTESEQSHYEGGMIIVYNGNIYEVDSALGILKCGDMAVDGSGTSVALGSLYSTQDMKAEDRIRIAIEACSKHLRSVGEGIDIEKV